MDAIRERSLSGFKYNFCGITFYYNPSHVKYASEIRAWVNSDGLINYYPDLFITRRRVFNYSVCSTAENVSYLMPTLTVQGVLTYMLLSFGEV